MRQPERCAVELSWRRPRGSEHGFIEAGLGTAGLLALTAGVVACSVVSLVFSDAVTFSSAMASSFK